MPPIPTRMPTYDPEELARMKFRAARAKEVPKKSLWERINEPLTDAPSRWGHDFADWMTTPEADDSWATAVAKGAVGGVGEGIGKVASGLTSPMNLGLTAATLGSGTAARMGAGTVSRALASVARLGGAAMMGHGGYNVAEGVANRDLGQVGSGAMEMGGGYLGARTPMNYEKPVSTGFPRGLPAFGETTTPGQPRFFAGRRGLVDADQPGVLDVSPVRPDFSEDATVLPREMEGLHHVDPITQANYSGTGEPIQMPQHGGSIITGDRAGKPVLSRPRPVQEPTYTDRFTGQDPNVPNVQPIDTVSETQLPKYPIGRATRFVPNSVKNQPELDFATRMRLRNDGVLNDVEPVGSSSTPRAQAARSGQGPLSRDFPDNKAIPETIADSTRQTQQSGRPYMKLAASDLKTLADRGDATAIKEISLRAKVANRSRLPLGARLKDETGAIGPGAEDFMQERAGNVEPVGGRLGRLATDESGQVNMDPGVIVQGAKDVLKKTGITRDKAIDAGGVPRSLMASMDVSAPFRQGVFLVGRKQFWTNLKPMFEALTSEKNFQEINNNIKASPRYLESRKAGLALNEMNDLSGREEQFMSNMAEHWGYRPERGQEGIPGVSQALNKTVGRVVRASGRAYTGFLNKVRSDVYTDIMNRAESVGNTNPKLAQQVARYVNTASGRGNLGVLEHSAKGLNMLLFSPRLIASRVKLLNPYTYLDPKTDPFVRREALKDLLKFAGAGTSIVGLAKAGGAEVETNPTSSDFGKININGTRFDVFGGFQPYVRLAAQLATGRYTSPITKKTQELGHTSVTPTRKDLVYRFGESKLAPIPSIVVDMLQGRDFTGQPFNLPTAVKNRVVPLMVQDIMQVAKDNPELLPAAIPAAASGIGVQTFSEDMGHRRRKTRSVKRSKR